MAGRRLRTETLLENDLPRPCVAVTVRERYHGSAQGTGLPRGSAVVRTSCPEFWEVPWDEASSLPSQSTAQSLARSPAHVRPCSGSLGPRTQEGEWRRQQELEPKLSFFSFFFFNPLFLS